MDTNDIGKYGEQTAVRYLMRSGYAILERNFRCRFGEIDIVAMKENVICFVEVKTRSSLYYGLPSEAVNDAKQKKLSKAALLYIGLNGCTGVGIRMDVIEIVVNGGKTFLRHIEDAFEILE